MAATPGAPDAVPPSVGVGPPFLGLFFDRAPHMVPPNGFSACSNVRIYLNQVTNDNMGMDILLSGTVDLLPTSPINGGGLFQLSLQAYQYLMIANDTDLFAFNSSAPPVGYTTATTPVYVTPVYTTGTASCAGATTAVVGAGTLWNTNIGTPGFRKNVRAGDYISFTADENSPLATWFKIASVTNDTHLVLTTNGPNTGGAVAYTIRQCMNSNVNTSARVHMEAFPNAGAPDNQDLCFFTNFGGNGPVFTRYTSMDPIIKWNPTLKHAVYLSTYAWTAGTLKRFNNVLIYGRLCNAGATSTTDLLQTSIASSDNGLPTSLASGVSFQGVVTDGPDPVQRLSVLGNSLLIYTGNNAGNPASPSGRSAVTTGGNIISAQFVGLPTIWQFQTVVAGRSPMNGALVAEFTDRHEFLSIEGEFRYNGMFLQVMNDHVWHGLLENIDFNGLLLAFNAQAPLVGDTLWFVPTLNPGNLPVNMTGYVEHYLEMASSYLFKPYTQRDGDYEQAASSTHTFFTCYLASSPENTIAITTPLLMGDNAGNVLSLYSIQACTLQLGKAMACSVMWGSRIIAGERSRGLVKRIYPFVDLVQAGGLGHGQPAGHIVLTITLKMQDRIGGAVTLTQTNTMDISALDTGTANRFVTPYRRGRVAQISFSVPGTVDGSPGNNTFFLDGYDWDLPQGSKGGQR